MSIKHFLLYLISVIFIPANIIWAAEPDSTIQTQAISEKDTTNKLPFIEEFSFYGSLRFIAGVSSNHNFAVRNNASHLGLEAKTKLTKFMTAVAGLEVGVGIVGTKTQVVFHGDPGGPVGEVDNVFTSRVAYIGIETKYGRLTWGKQWSPYYMVAGLTDQFNAYGAEASGAFARHTDGDIQGTGRAAHALQYHLMIKRFEVLLQIQHRDLTNVRVYPSAYCGGFLIHNLYGFTFGASYSRVQDGIDDPEVWEPKKGDEAAVFGLSWQYKKFKTSATYSRFKNHEIDDEKNFFDGWGMEYYIGYYILDGWRAYCGFNVQKPLTDNAGDYLLRYLVFGTGYSFKDKFTAFVEYKWDDSSGHKGNLIREDIIGFGMFYNFYFRK